MTAAMRAFAAEHVAGRNLDDDAFPHDLWQDMAAAGLFRIGLAEGGYAAIAAAETELVEAGGSLGFALSWAGHQLVARYFLMGFGDEAQRAAWLPGLIEGRLTAAVAISEPQAGAHPKLLKTTATTDGDSVGLDGEKAWVTNGPIADLFIVLAISAMAGERKRYSAYLVPRTTPGLAIIATKPLGFLRPSPHCGLRLAGARVPAANRLGPADGAYEAMALPFRDVEDTVGTGALHGALRHLLARAASGGVDVDVLGELAAQTALIGQGARAVVAALDAGAHDQGEAPATVIGIRSLAGQLVKRFRDLGLAPPMLRDLEGTFGVAQGPRQARLRRLGERWLSRARA